MKKITYWGKPKQPVEITKYTLYINTCKGKKQKWAGECDERIEIDNRLKKYIENNDYVSATIICEHDGGHYIEYLKYNR